MPKKPGTNPKSLAARERVAEKKKEANEKKARELEEEFWKDDDKYINRKLQRKDEREAKLQEQLDKKKEKQKLFEEEVESITNAKGTSVKGVPSKFTQAQISSARVDLTARLEALKRKSQKQEQEELEPNPNRIQVDGEEARTIEDAIVILSVKEPTAGDVDRHPEKRLKAAYLAFEEKLLPLLRQEFPGLRTSQLKQIAFKRFQTAPENPKNQQHAVYNAS